MRRRREGEHAEVDSFPLQESCVLDDVAAAVSGKDFRVGSRSFTPAELSWAEWTHSSFDTRPESL